MSEICTLVQVVAFCRMNVCVLYSCPSCGILQNECLRSVLLSKLWHSAEWMSVICTLVQVVAFCRMNVCDLYSCPSCGILQNERLWSVLLSKLWHSAEWMSVICTLVQVVAFYRMNVWGLVQVVAFCRMNVWGLYSCPSCGILQNECLWSVDLSKLWHSADWKSVICSLVQVVAFCRQSKPWFSNRFPEKENMFSKYSQYWLPNYSLLTLSFKAWQLITVQNLQIFPSILRCMSHWTVSFDLFNV